MTDDADIEAFILAADRNAGFSDLEAMVADRFGADAGWTKERIADFWRWSVPVLSGKPSRLERDHDVRRFVEDRLHRQTLDEIRAACAAAFGAARTPSRSALHRYGSRLRRLAAFRRSRQEAR